MRILDLFCGAGGAGQGYAQAGFDVFGVDINPQPNCPHDFMQHDALRLPLEMLKEFDAVHASPPCQPYSTLRSRHSDREYPALVAATREMLLASGLPYIIENVMGAPLFDPVVLQGRMFPGLRVVRKRQFETNWPLPQPPQPEGPNPPCHTYDKRKAHYGKTDPMKDFVTVTGWNCPVDAARDAMGIPWMTREELTQAIPPAFTEYIGGHLLAYLEGR